MRRGGIQSARRQRLSGKGNGLISQLRGGRGAVFSLSFLRAKGKPASRPRGRDFRRASLNHNSQRRGNPRQPLYNPYSTRVGASRGYPPHRRRARKGGYAGCRGDFCPTTNRQPVIFVLSPRPMVFSLSPLVASAGRAPFTIQPRANHKNFKGPPRRRSAYLVVVRLSQPAHPSLNPKNGSRGANFSHAEAQRGREC